jgi:hypothetical protein
MEDSYNFTICFTSALYEGVRSTTRPGRFTTGKETWNPVYRRLDGPQGQSVRVWKISPPSGFEEVLIYKKHLMRRVYCPEDVMFLLYDNARFNPTQLFRAGLHKSYQLTQKYSKYVFC